MLPDLRLRRIRHPKVLPGAVSQLSGTPTRHRMGGATKKWKTRYFIEAQDVSKIKWLAWICPKITNG